MKNENVNELTTEEKAMKLQELNDVIDQKLETLKQFVEQTNNRKNDLKKAKEMANDVTKKISEYLKTKGYYRTYSHDSEYHLIDGKKNNDVDIDPYTVFAMCDTKGFSTENYFDDYDDVDNDYVNGIESYWNDVKSDNTREYIEYFNRFKLAYHYIEFNEDYYSRFEPDPDMFWYFKDVKE